ncbi:cell division protein ZapE [Parathalassolituus penaei]|uniref:Cell division protein ZapE n=1 Tax=Parathalassolituus penaei TaxID=2997323 RepID=A0A9X3EGY9_9GAMM|nr:cell division protein ZapE [Parathalassolituus penaei]MCY0966559.1 cell division protein ZapE [Parathalassolituus penaei]
MVERTSLVQHLQNQGVELDDSQRQAAEALEQLQHQSQRPKRKVAFFRRRQPRGAYLWGEPGRGKTLLMDALFALYPEASRRLHYHHFLRELHRGMSRPGGGTDFLITLAHEVAANCRMFCLDEFHVHDGADAVLLERFLAVLLKQQVFVVLTSNYPPDNLLPDPNHHHKAQKIIALVNRNFDILHLDGARDYRRRGGDTSLQYLAPADEVSDHRLLALLATAGCSLTLDNRLVRLSGRAVNARAEGEGVVWFDFEAICMGPRSHLDYLEIAERWSQVVVSGIHRRLLHEPNALRRLIWLVDVLYEHRLRLWLISEEPILELLSDPELEADTVRLVSRLMEMQLLVFGGTSTARTGLLDPS